MESLTKYQLGQLMIERIAGGELPDSDWTADLKLGIAIGIAAARQIGNGAVSRLLPDVDAALSAARAAAAANEGEDVA